MTIVLNKYWPNELEKYWESNYTGGTRQGDTWLANGH